jgi:nicotinamidase-related amidase
VCLHRTLLVPQSARHAYELGFNVVVAIDAVTDMNHDAHANSITREIIDLLQRGAG